MSGQGDKGKFSTDISQDVIDAALRSVKRHTGDAAAPAAGPAASAPDAPLDAKTEEHVLLDVEVTSPALAPLAPDEVPGDGTAAAPSGAPNAELEDLKVQLELSMQKGREMMEKVKDSHERMLRAVADLDNFKKRAQKEKDEVTRFGAEKLLKDFLPVIDNLDRALEHAKTSTDIEALRQGVVMTRKSFEDSLSRHGVKSFTTVGKPFDPRFHEAMSQVETAELPPQHVVHEAVRGFTLNDRLIRPALVTVSLAPAAAAPAEPAPAQSDNQTSDTSGDAAAAVAPGTPDTQAGE